MKLRSWLRVSIAQADSILFAQNSTLVIRLKTVAHPAGFEFHAVSLKDDGTAVETTSPWEDHAPGEEIASTFGQTNKRSGKHGRLSTGSDTPECDKDDKPRIISSHGIREMMATPSSNEFGPLRGTADEYAPSE